ncbi:MAG: TOBE domain-containing protein, partial [Ruminiclostridium sp.]|nr:TOBE domain-containing protein [Ruminiclostridium sp.]
HDEEMFLSAATTGIIEANVDVTEMMGAETYLYLTCEGTPITARVSPRCTARPQDVVKLAIDPNKIHLFDASDEHAILS